MKANLTQVFRYLNWSVDRVDVEPQLVQLKSQIQQLNRIVKEKDCLIDSLRHQLSSSQAKLIELGGTDQLTGLANRQVFKEHLTYSLKKAVRLGYSLSLLLIDIAQLRDISLRYGHDTSDLLLIEVSKILRVSVREIDRCARWGAEELSAVLHETDMDEAMVVAERIRKRVAGLNIKNPKDGKPINISATIAVASYPKHGSDPQTLLEITSETIQCAQQKNFGQVLLVTV